MLRERAEGYKGDNSGSCVTYGLLWGLSIYCCLWPSCCTSCLSMGQRKRIREAYNLKGSDCKSCCFSFWGCWCEVGQTKLELNARAGQPVIVRPKQMAPPGVQQMSSTPQMSTRVSSPPAARHVSDAL